MFKSAVLALFAVLLFAGCSAEQSDVPPRSGLASVSEQQSWRIATLARNIEQCRVLAQGKSESADAPVTCDQGLTELDQELLECCDSTNATKDGRERYPTQAVREKLTLLYAKLRLYNADCRPTTRTGLTDDCRRRLPTPEWLDDALAAAP